MNGLQVRYLFDHNIIFIQQPYNARQGKLRFLDFVQVGVDGVVSSSSEINFFQVGILEFGFGQVAVIKAALAQVAIGKIGFVNSAMYEGCFL